MISDESVSKFILSGIAAHTVVKDGSAGTLSSDFTWMEGLETRPPYERYGGQAVLNATTGDLLYITLRVCAPATFLRTCVPTIYLRVFCGCRESGTRLAPLAGSMRSGCISLVHWWVSP